MEIEGIDPVLISLANTAANKQADALEVNGQLPLGRDAFVRQKTEVLAKQFFEEEKALIHSMGKAGELLVEEYKLLPEPEQKLRAEEIRNIQDKIHQNVMAEELASSSSLQNLLGLNDEYMRWIYHVGYKYFELKKNEEASTLFFMLTLLNPLVSDYRTALGFAQESLSLNKEALNSFSMATILNPENPIPRYQAAEIYLKAGQTSEAIAELEALLKIIEEKKLDSIKPVVENLLLVAKNSNHPI